MNHLECFSSITCRNTPFNALVAETLANPLIGADVIVTDGSPCYNSIRSYNCLFHKVRNFALDPFLARQRSNKLPPSVISSYTSDIYSFAKTEYEEWLRGRYPDLVDDGQSMKFIGATTTNAMEGGNWRMKYELRTAYQNDGSAEARYILLALKDSLQTFKEGRPHRSFANINGGFESQNVMDGRRRIKTTIADEPVEKYIYR